MTTVDTATTRSRPTGVRTARDLTLLLGRVGLAVLMIAHAKLEYDYGGGSIAGVGRLFEQAGVPLASLTGPANLLLEAIGGIALILGLAVPAVGVLMALNMLGAWVLVHPTALYAADHTGPETVIAIGLLSLVLAATGSGRFGLDHLIASHAGRAEPRLRHPARSTESAHRRAWPGGPAERRQVVRNRIAATARSAASGSSPRLVGRAWLSQRVAKPWTSHQAATPARGMSGPRPVAVTDPTPL